MNITTKVSWKYKKTTRANRKSAKEGLKTIANSKLLSQYS